MTQARSLPSPDRPPSPSPSPSPKPAPPRRPTPLNPHLRAPTPLRPHALALPSLSHHLITKYTPSNSPSPSSPPQSPPPAPPPDPHLRAFCALLDADARLDEPKLRRAAASGVPPALRAAVWPLLLARPVPRRAHDLSLRRARLVEYDALVSALHVDQSLIRRVRRILARHRAPFSAARAHSLFARADQASRDRVPEPKPKPKLPLQGQRRGPFGAKSSGKGRGDGGGGGTEGPPGGGGGGGGGVGGGGGGGGVGGGVGVGNDSVFENGGGMTDVSKEASLQTPSNGGLSSSRVPKSRAVDTHVVTTFSRVVAAYLCDAPPAQSFDDALVYLCAPFVETMDTEADAFHGLHALLRDHGALFTADGLRDATSEFLALFRSLAPRLYDHFVAEEVDMQAWARGWLRGLLVEQLPRHALLRLWDSYFATEDGLALHPFVCLVYVQHLAPELHDCDDAERIQAMLSALPAIDMDHVVAHAVTTRDELCERGAM